MSYEKLQAEHYQNLGGINTKVSPYLNSVREFRDLSNFDFRVPGSLTQRDGFTQNVFFAMSGPITSLFNLYGYKYIGNTIFAQVSMIIGTADSRGFFQQGTSLVTFQSGLDNSNRTYFVKSYSSWAFLANGRNFIKFNGLTYRIDTSTGGTIPTSSPTLVVDYDSSLFSLPPGPAFTVVPYKFGSALNLSTGPWTGVFSYKLSWVNRRGFIGPPGPAATIALAGLSGYLALGSGLTSSGGITTVLGFTVPASYAIGLTANNSFLGLSNTSSVNLAVFRTNGVSSDYFFLSYALSTPETFGPLDSNTTTLGITTVPTCVHFTLVPRYIEMFNNQMFFAGFTQAPQTIAFSDIGEPESVQPENTFDIQSPLGDFPSGLVFYNGRLMCFKDKSVFVVTGDNPSNFVVTQITNDYGCLNNAAAVYNNLLLFLDEKGVVEYNGANLRIVSDRVEAIFRNMNIEAARTTAIMFHMKIKNQIWIGIPCNGATENNCTVIYDYVADAWTKYEGFNPSAFNITNINYPENTSIFGSYSGMVYNFNASFTADNGQGMTVLFKSRYDQPEGKAITKQFRQLYVDANPLGGTGAVEVQCFPNYGQSASLTRTMNLTEYQTRIDFGLPATSMQIQLKRYDTTEKLVVNGFILASRFQRKTGAFSQGD